MLIVKSIDLSSSKFKKIKIVVQSGLTNKELYIENNAVFHSGNIEEGCMDKICDKIYNWIKDISPSEIDSIENIRDMIQKLR